MPSLYGSSVSIVTFISYFNFFDLLCSFLTVLSAVCLQDIESSFQSPQNEDNQRKPYLVQMLILGNIALLLLVLFCTLFNTKIKFLKVYRRLRLALEIPFFSFAGFCVYYCYKLS